MSHCYELALCPHQTLLEQPDVASCTCCSGDSQGDTGDKEESGDSLEEWGRKAALTAAWGREDDSKGRFERAGLSIRDPIIHGRI